MNTGSPEQGDIINHIAETTVMLTGVDIPMLGAILRDLDHLDPKVFAAEIRKTKEVAEALILDEFKDPRKGLSALNRCVEQLQNAFNNTRFASLDERQGKRKRLEQEDDTGISGEGKSTIPLDEEEQNAIHESGDTPGREEINTNYEALLTAIREDDTVYREFVDEAVVNLSEVEQHLLALESNPDDPSLIDAVFRPFHTIKGVAGFLNLVEINKLSHLYEDLLDSIRRRQVEVSRKLIDVILEGVDTLRRLISELSDGLNKDKTPDFRVDLEAFQKKIQKAQQGRPGSSKKQKKAVETKKQEGESPAKDIDLIHDSYIRVDINKLDQLVDMMGELVIIQNIITDDPRIANNTDEKLQRNITQLKRITGQLRDLSTALRMVPVRDMFQKMQRVVRDLSRKSKKEIALEIHGETTEIDRSIADELYEPLIHIIRNNCDHGIEPPDERMNMGKSRTGTIALNAYHHGGRVILEISDDGRGIDFKAVRKKAIDRRLIRANEKVPEGKLLEMIFNPDFSTSETVTEISGRGVGLDVVKRTVNRLNGNVEVQTEPGEGSTFVINLPLTLAMIDGVLVKVGGERYIIPSVHVRETFRPLQSQHRYLAGKGEFLLFRDEILPLIRLGRLFEVHDAAEELEEMLALVVEDKKKKAVLLVDQLVDKQELVIKSLGDQFGQLEGLAGGAILADGQIGLIIDVGTLLPEVSV